VAMSATTAILGYKLLAFKPPPSANATRNTLYYFGYNEKGMCSLYVNLVAAFAYYAKMASHISGDPVKGNVVYYQYFDYMFTCPLLTLDLLWTLNLPYKVTYALLVFLTLFSGFMSSGHPQPGRWMWFSYGMVMFSFTWLRIVGLVQVRFMQYFAKKDKSLRAQNGDSRMSLAERGGFRSKTVRNPLQFALSVYFTIWMIYPILWLLLEGKLISNTVAHCCNVVMDVLAKSMYGFALLKFQLLIDKTQIEFGELRVTKSELVEELMEEKKKVRKVQKQLDEEEMARQRAENMLDDDDIQSVVPTLPRLESLSGPNTNKKKKKRGGSLRSGSTSPAQMSPRQQMVPMPMPASMPLFPQAAAAGAPRPPGGDMQGRTSSWRDV